jgi:hypothetical protein
MRVHPPIAALRSPDAAQRRAMARTASAMQTARETALAVDGLKGVSEELARYGVGVELASCPRLEALLTDRNSARATLEEYCAPLLSSLRTNPLGEAPLPFQTAKGFTAVELARSGRAVLKLAVYEPIDTSEPPKTALFADREVVELVVAGSAEGLTHTLSEDGGLETRRAALKPGVGMRTLPLRTSRQIVCVDRSLLLIQLMREPEKPRPTCEIALDTGETVRTASGDKSASQALMALSVLGAMGAYRALGTMEDSALNLAEDNDVRWEAVRQTLGMGPVRGMDLLETLVSRPDDPLSTPAAQLRARLIEAQPELASLGSEQA